MLLNAQNSSIPQVFLKFQTHCFIFICPYFEIVIISVRTIPQSFVRSSWSMPLEFLRSPVTVPMRSAFSTRLPTGDLFGTHLHWRKSYCEEGFGIRNVTWNRLVITADFSRSIPPYDVMYSSAVCLCRPFI